MKEKKAMNASGAKDLFCTVQLIDHSQLLPLSQMYKPHSFGISFYLANTAIKKLVSISSRIILQHFTSL